MLALWVLFKTKAATTVPSITPQNVNANTRLRRNSGASRSRRVGSDFCPNTLSGFGSIIFVDLLNTSLRQEGGPIKAQPSTKTKSIGNIFSEIRNELIRYKNHV